MNSAWALSDLTLVLRLQLINCTHGMPRMNMIETLHAAHEHDRNINMFLCKKKKKKESPFVASSSAQKEHNRNIILRSNSKINMFIDQSFFFIPQGYVFLDLEDYRASH